MLRTVAYLLLMVIAGVVVRASPETDKFIDLRRIKGIVKGIR